MSTEHQQFENENERLLSSKQYLTEYGIPKAHQSIPVEDHLQQQSQTIVRVNNSVPYIKDYFNLALFVTLCCCLPFGIVALIKSNEVKTRAASGDQEGALKASKSAKMWSQVGLIAALFQFAIVAIAIVLSVVLSNLYNNDY